MGRKTCAVGRGVVRHIRGAHPHNTQIPSPSHAFDGLIDRSGFAPSVRCEADRFRLRARSQVVILPITGAGVVPASASIAAQLARRFGLHWPVVVVDDLATFLFALLLSGTLLNVAH